MKFKITLVAVCEYEPNEEFYESKNPGDMLKTDLDNFKDDPDFMLDMPETTFKWKGEIINETDNIEKVQV